MDVMTDPEVMNHVKLLSKAVCTTLSDGASQQDRAEAYHFLETFKDSSAHMCINCGFLMAKKENTDIDRHLGLQLLEHVVKFKWLELDIDRKLYVMENTIGLMANGTNDILTERMYIKDALTRIVVEMIKKEWPQQWPDLLQKLEMLTGMGPTQAELVLFIFLRLAEDIVTFQNMPGQRRREIHQTLNTKMTGIFSFFINILENGVNHYLNMRNGESEQNAAQSHCQVVRTVLLTLTGYVDWINHTILFETNPALLSMLCLLLGDENLQRPAADVLHIIVSRKGKVEERKPLLKLFNDEPMSMILNAAIHASTKDLEESHYLFLKTLCQVLIGIGMQLCTLWDAENGFGKPDNFSKYLHAIMAITGHASQTLGSYTHPLWIHFIKHAEISRDSDFLSSLPELMNKVMVSLQKVGFPSQSNAVSCMYSRLDFDSDDEFSSFFARYRADVCETIRSITGLLPKMASQLAGDWLVSVLNKNYELGPESEHGLCTYKSLAFIEWEAMTCFLENVHSKLAHVDEEIFTVADQLALLKTVVGHCTEDPLILSCLLSCISAIFHYVVNVPEMLPPILEKIFKTVNFSLGGQTKGTRIKSVQNVRRHACSIMVKVCKNHPSLLLPRFDELCRHIDTISSDSEDALSQMERCTLMEALILINNHFMNYQKQAQFIGGIMMPVRQFWLSKELERSLSASCEYMRFVGLDRAPVEPGVDDQCGINRSAIMNALNTILAVIKRSQCPDDSLSAKQGGFMEIVNGKEILNNPATDHVMVLLGNIFSLIKVSNELWLAQNQALCHPDYAGSFDMLDVDKQILLGIPTKCADSTDPASSSARSPVLRMLTFLQFNNDHAYHILGNAAKTFRHRFFSAPELVSMIVDKVFFCLGSVPDYRIRPLLRSFMKPLVQQCPEEMYGSVCIPVLSVLCKFMLERLDTKWQIIHHRNTVNEDDADNNPESKEVLEDLLIRQLTREYMELLVDVCMVRKSSPAPADDAAMDDDVANDRADVTLSQLGEKVLTSEQTCEPFVLALFRSLSWNDTTTCHKAIPLCALTLKHLIADQKLSSDAAVHLFTAILSGLRLHGQHEASQPLLVGLALNAYLLFRPVFPEITNVMHQIPSCTPNDLKVFDDKFLQPKQQKSHEKKRRDAFKKLVCDVVAKSLAHHFKKEVPIQDLPKLFVERKAKPAPLIQDNSEISGLVSLFNDDQNGQ